MDPYIALLERLDRQHLPFSVTWELTHACNLRCAMCYNVPLSRPELSTGECLGVLDQLARAGVLLLTLTGGEILTRPDFFTIAQRARQLGFALVLKTNAALITSLAAADIAALRPIRVDISLPGATAETSDRVTGGTRTLENVLGGIAHLHENQVPVKLNTGLTVLNAAEQRAMVALARRLRLPYEQVVKVSPDDAGRDSGVGLPAEQMAEALEQDGWWAAPREWKPNDRTCNVGLSSCAISPYGAVYPCVQLRIAAGDLRRQAFGEIWEAPIFEQLRADHIFANLTRCRTCAVQAWCEGRCSGNAWKEHGDLFREDIAACCQARARHRQAVEAPLPAGRRREYAGRETAETN